EIERDATVAAACPLLPMATRLIGHFQIRNRGTLGGSIAHADPAAEYPAVAVALGAEFVLSGPGGTRTVSADRFFTGPFSTGKQPDELLVELRFPTESRAVSIKEVARRHGDFAIALVVVALGIAGGKIESAGIGLGGVAPTPISPGTAIATLVGQRPSRELFEEAARAAARESQPSSDIHGSANYRRSLVETLTSRALAEAAGDSLEVGS
ncbi:MAG: FAD binding domain-containing protein, partial [Actinomycetota bacterium]|nr:FAD binding domain-containing protein [Actinomycetota bacterium]